MSEIYLITAIHADGSRRQWAGPKPKTTLLPRQEVEMPYTHDFGDPFYGDAQYHTAQKLSNIPDCPHKDTIYTE